MIALLLSLSFLTGQQQLQSPDVESPLVTLGLDPTLTDTVDALWVNPAGLAWRDDSGFSAFYVQRQSSFPNRFEIGGAAKISIPLLGSIVFGADAINRNFGGFHRQFTRLVSGSAWKILGKGGIIPWSGMGELTFGLTTTTYGGEWSFETNDFKFVPGLDLGFQWRLTPWLGLSGYIRNLTEPRQDDLRFYAEYGLGMALRFWDGRLSLAGHAWVSTQERDDGDGTLAGFMRFVHWRASVLATIVPGLQLTATVTSGFDRPDRFTPFDQRTYHLQVGLSFSGEYWGLGLGSGFDIPSTASFPLETGIVRITGTVNSKPTLGGPPQRFLRYEFGPDLSEEVPLTPFGGIGTRFSQILLQLDRAREYDWVQGLVLVVRANQLSLSQALELHDVIKSTRDAGKTVFVFLANSSLASYIIASAGSHVYGQVSSLIDVSGIYVRTLFFKNLLDELGIEVNPTVAGDYKTYLNQFLEENFTDAHREALTAIVDAAYNTVVAKIAAARDLDEASVKDTIDFAPLSVSDAIRARFIDGELTPLGFERMLEARRVMTRDLAAVTYVEQNVSSWITKPRFIIIPVVGAMNSGFSVGNNANPDRLAELMQMLEDDPGVAGVILRVDSPGGSVVASAILQEAVRRLAEVKPVVVSMSSIAASAGYAISAEADYIVANPMTQTGSIGVFTNRWDVSELGERIGIDSDAISRGENAGWADPLRPLSPAGEANLERRIDEYYLEFILQVARARGLDEDAVREIAQGRVWTGETALELGLVDELGDITTAVRWLEEATGVDYEDAELRVLSTRGFNLVEWLINNARAGGGLIEVPEWLSSFVSLLISGEAMVAPTLDLSGRVQQ